MLLVTTSVLAQDDHEFINSFGQFKDAAPVEHQANALDSTMLDNFFKAEEVNQLTPLERFDKPQNKSIPFIHEVKFDGNDLKVTISITGRSYIYRSSLNVVVDPKEITYQRPTLPPATEHTDALGKSWVYFNELSFTIPIVQAQADSYMIVHYQGCDESGICYPPQSIVIAIPTIMGNDKTLKQRNDGFTPLDDSSPKLLGLASEHMEDGAAPTINGNTVALADSKNDEDYDSLLSQEGIISFFTNGKGENSDTISQLLSENLLVGLIICFLLGIGLDLTPCVLPMLPIFSAMIVGSKQSSIKVVDVLEQDHHKKVEANSKVRRFNFIFMQNLGFALGLALTYTLLGLLFSLAGAQLHGILQSSALNFILAFLMIVCALACANLFEIKMPSFITSRLQKGTSMLNTSKFQGAFLLGASAAIIASPCTSAPLAGALLYVMKNGDMLMGALVFFTIGMGMAMPLFAIGMFGSRALQKSGIIGDIIKRLMVVVLLATAFIIVRHNLGRAELFVGSLLVYVISVYTLVSIVFFIRRRAIPIMMASAIALAGLVPTYFSLGYFEKSQEHHAYKEFYIAQDMATFEHLTDKRFAFVVFTADWCSNCKIMEKNIYSTEHFINSSMGIQRIVVNITNPKDPEVAKLIERFDVIGVPFFVTLNQEGEKVDQKLGLASSQHVFQALDELRKQKGQ